MPTSLNRSRSISKSKTTSRSRSMSSKSVSRSVSRSKSRDRSRKPGYNGNRSNSPGSNVVPYEEENDVKNPGNQVYVRGLSADTNEQHLRDRFEKYGTLEEISIVKDPHIGECRGFGFVRYSNKTAAIEAIRGENNTLMRGRTLIVELSKRNRPRPKTPGEYLGYKSTDYNYRRRYGSRRDDYSRSRSRSRSRPRSRRYGRPTHRSSGYGGQGYRDYSPNDYYMGDISGRRRYDSSSSRSSSRSSYRYRRDDDNRSSGDESYRHRRHKHDRHHHSSHRYSREKTSEGDRYKKSKVKSASISPSPSRRRRTGRATSRERRDDKY